MALRPSARRSMFSDFEPLLLFSILFDMLSSVTNTQCMLLYRLHDSLIRTGSTSASCAVGSRALVAAAKACPLQLPTVVAAAELLLGLCIYIHDHHGTGLQRGNTTEPSDIKCCY